MRVSIGAFVLAAGVLLFIVNLVLALRGGEPAGNDPWGGDTLEWSESSPPANAQFARIPVVRSRHPMWDQVTLMPVPGDDADVVRAARQLDHAPSRWRGSLIVRSLDGQPLAMAHLPRRSFCPFIVSIGFTLLFIAALVKIGWVFWSGVAVVLGGLIGWYWPQQTETEVLGFAGTTSFLSAAMMVAGVMWAVPAPHYPRGRGVALNASVLSYSTGAT